jgi:hypothetical protein
LAVRIRNWMAIFRKRPIEEVLEFEPLSEVGHPGRKRSVHRFKHKAGGKTYTNPRIILSPEFMDMVGRSYRVFRSRAVHKETQEGGQELRREDGTVIVLFFPDNDNVSNRNL